MPSAAQPLSLPVFLGLPMDWERLEQDLQKVLEELTEKNRLVPIIVEGEYDRRSLRALGLLGDIRMVNEGSTIFGLCESIAAAHREAIILTDWDVRGGRLARQLRDGLSANGVRFDEGLRARLTRLCRKDITDVESLHGFVERVAEHASSGHHHRDSKRWYSNRVFRRQVERRSRK
jgi:5S rRNA maturation endonuclease (ribonuclease M5)